MKNVLGSALAPCSHDPMTGFHRDGCCRLDPRDPGGHLICAVMTERFLSFSRARGNDLTTPLPRYGFPGLREGDRWCLCALRWREAMEAGEAPPVVLEATHEAALSVVDLEDMLAHAVPQGSA